MMNELYKAFDDRRIEVETYIDFLESLEKSAQNGPPKLENSEHVISSQQLKILYSSVYLQLYNLVESTITRCLDAVTKAAIDSGTFQVIDLSEALRSEWVRGIARTHIELNTENRFIAAMELCNHLLEKRPLTDLSIERGGGGNWDDISIEKISVRIGFTLQLSQAVKENVKRKIRDDKGSLSLVKHLRNNLAHGKISFEECAHQVNVSDLRDLKDNTVNYLGEVVTNFVNFIDSFEYLAPNRRPGNL